MFSGPQIGANCPWNDTVLGARCEDMAWGIREPEELLIPKDQYWQQESRNLPAGLTTKSGKSNQRRQEQVLSARRPQGWRGQGPQ